MTQQREPEYDVALSFAGEDRDFVRRVAEGLERARISFFYDEYQATDLWGQDLAVHLDEVYRKRARYVVPFVSRHYAEKVWPRQEFRSALARAIEEKGPYILPVRLDQTELPGLRPTIGYLGGHREGPDGIVARIVEKLGRKATTTSRVEAPPAARIPTPTPGNFNPYEEAERALQTINDALLMHRSELEGKGYVVHPVNRDGRLGLRILASGRPIFFLDMWIGTQGFGDNALCFNDGRQESSSPGSMTAVGTIRWDSERGESAIDLINFSLLNMWESTKTRISPTEIADAIWKKILAQLRSTAGL